MTNDVIHVLLADDHSVVRAGIKAVLSSARDIQVIGEAGTGRAAVLMTERLNPDVVVMDLTMPDIDGIEATKAIVAKGLSARVLILTMHSEEEYLVPLMEAGAAGFLMKSAADRELVDAVRAVAYGDVYVRPGAARLLARNLACETPAQPERGRFDSLTPREQSVLRLVAQGYTAPEIGERLVISPKTVDTYKQRIHEKLGFARRAEYVQFALKLGLLAEA